jgi:hypothetical protein
MLDVNILFPEPTDYDIGYASIPEDIGIAVLHLQMGWLSAQLAINPKDDFRRGRLDAFMDRLARLK